MSTIAMAIFSNPLFATYTVYARNTSIDTSNDQWHSGIKTWICAECWHFKHI